MPYPLVWKRTFALLHKDKGKSYFFVKWRYFKSYQFYILYIYYNVLQLPTVGDQKYTTRGEAELCILLMVHHEAKLSCVCIRHTTKRSWVVYLPIHHEAKLSCVCLRILTVSSWRTILYNNCCVFCRWR